MGGGDPTRNIFFPLSQSFELDSHHQVLDRKWISPNMGYLPKSGERKKKMTGVEHDWENWNPIGDNSAFHAPTSSRTNSHWREKQTRSLSIHSAGHGGDFTSGCPLSVYGWVGTLLVLGRNIQFCEKNHQRQSNLDVEMKRRFGVRKWLNKNYGFDRSEQDFVLVGISINGTIWQWFGFCCRSYAFLSKS